MATPPVIHHALLRPCILHILRAAGYQSTKPSVLDSLTDIAGRYLELLAQTTASHSFSNHGDLDIAITDVRMAMQDCGALAPEKLLEDQIYEGEEDTRGVDAFTQWVTGSANKEINRIALEGDEGKEDYLTTLKKKFDKTDDDTRYNNTILGETLDQPKQFAVEGADSISIAHWQEKLLERPSSSGGASKAPSRLQSSDLSSLDGNIDEDIEMGEDLDD